MTTIRILKDILILSLVAIYFLSSRDSGSTYTLLFDVIFGLSALLVVATWVFRYYDRKND